MRLKTLFPALTETNYSKASLSEDEIRRIVAAAGGVAAVLNTRHEIAKDNGWKETSPSVDAFAAAAAAEPNLLRRPIVMKDGKVVVGKDEAGWQDLSRG